MWLSCRNHKFKIVKLIFNFNHFCQQDGSDLSTSNNSYFEIWKVLTVWQISHGDLIKVCLLITFFSLIDESMFIKDKLVVNTCIENTLEHYNISNNFTCHESILHLFIWDEVIKPVLAKFWNTTHLKEVCGFHVTTNRWLVSLCTS